MHVVERQAGSRRAHAQFSRDGGNQIEGDKSKDQSDWMNVERHEYTDAHEGGMTRSRRQSDGVGESHHGQNGLGRYEDSILLKESGCPFVQRNSRVADAANEDLLDRLVTPTCTQVLPELMRTVGRRANYAEFRDQETKSPRNRTREVARRFELLQISRAASSARGKPAKAASDSATSQLSGPQGGSLRSRTSWPLPSCSFATAMKTTVSPEYNANWYGPCGFFWRIFAARKEASAAKGVIGVDSVTCTAQSAPEKCMRRGKINSTRPDIPGNTIRGIPPPVTSSTTFSSSGGEVPSFGTDTLPDPVRSFHVVPANSCS
ncbi:hypothetical protein DFH09DRAFT_1086725 [Mycena vulgaris]|nr:hypothetical protein DFH09DRAFT_1086725 [Mycena vulgaris]